LTPSRGSVDQRIDRLGLAWADALRWGVYLQDTADRQLAFEDRNAAPDRVRDGRYAERSVGASVEADKRIDGRWPQRLTWGADVARTRYENLRDGVVPPVGQPFPYKDFPDTDYTLIGIFAQDDIALADTDASRWCPRCATTPSGWCRRPVRCSPARRCVCPTAR
jgi:hemoglobin/transferrin/lactoferrin receptor protein